MRLRKEKQLQQCGEEQEKLSNGGVEKKKSSMGSPRMGFPGLGKA
jgi:hypothetical protein